MRIKYIIFLFFIVCLSTTTKASQNTIDSLVSLSKIEKNDSVLLQLYNHIGSVSNNEDGQLSEEYWTKALELATQKVKENRTAYFLEQLSTANNGMGIISKRNGNLSDAISYYQKSIIINQELNNLDKMHTNYYNIGVIYRNLKEYDKSLEYYQKSLKYREEISDTSNMLKNYLSIGVLCRRMGDHDKALEYYHKSLKLAELINNEEMAAHTYSNIGVIHNLNENYAEAIVFFNKAFKYITTTNNQADIAKYHSNIMSSYNGLGDTQKAIKEGEIAYTMYFEMNRIADISTVANKLSSLYAKSNNYKKAYKSYKEYITYRDSVYNETNTREVTEKEMQFEFDKKNMTDSLARAEAEKIQKIEYQQELSEQRMFMYGGSFILLIVLIFSIIIFNRLKITKRQKAVIERQKLIVEEKNKEITDSITYAKRIQSAILPSLEVIKDSLPNSFVFYKPKDIVAGDFYWLAKKENKILLAVADCTGHGVPGAMVSVVCHNALNRAVNDFNLIDPSKILDKTAELVIDAFKKNNEDVKDGMDISLCSFDLKNKKLEYAGAINSLFYIRENKLTEIKGDKQPIGQYANIEPFTSHQIELKENDIFYLFSDGYPDQFGGEKGKKYMYKRFRELILDLSDKEFSKQKNILENDFNLWKKDLEQVDDVCVVGVKI